MRNFNSPPPQPFSPLAGQAKQTYTIRVITPMFGGGVVAGENDPKMLIRPMSIRGHLRFWWRATRGKAFASVKEMREAEQKIWGSTENPSKIAVKVKINSKGKPQRCAEFPQDKNFPIFAQNHPAYALFPFQGKKTRQGIEKQPSTGTNNIEFTLQIFFPENAREDVETAVWAWVNFGGLGARTRRGCGALYCKELAPLNMNDLQNWFQKKLNGIEKQPAAAANWLTLANKFYYGQSQTDAMEVWNSLIGVYRHFRQGEGVGRNQGQQRNRPGRTRWAEAETIRDITRQASPQHRQRYVEPRQNAFPRAEFGLPIITHFKDAGEPDDTEINHPQGERMGSPLILRPLQTQDGKVVPIVLRMQTEPLRSAVIKKGKQVLKDNVPVQVPALADWRDSPMHNLTKTGSALEAFLNYCKREQNYTEVSR